MISDRRPLIRWHDSNEQFTVAEYIKANCEYPGDWTYVIDRIEKTEHGLVTAITIASGDIAFKVVSFLMLDRNKITHLDEYFVTFEEVPQWRKDMNLGTHIQS